MTFYNPTQLFFSSSDSLLHFLTCMMSTEYGPETTENVALVEVGKSEWIISGYFQWIVYPARKEAYWKELHTLLETGEEFYGRRE